MKYRIKYKSLDTHHKWQSGGTFPKKQAEEIAERVVANHKQKDLNIKAWIESEPEGQKTT